VIGFFSFVLFCCSWLSVFLKNLLASSVVLGFHSSSPFPRLLRPPPYPLGGGLHPPAMSPSFAVLGLCMVGFVAPSPPVPCKFFRARDALFFIGNPPTAFRSVTHSRTTCPFSSPSFGFFFFRAKPETPLFPSSHYDPLPHPFLPSSLFCLSSLCLFFLYFEWWARLRFALPLDPCKSFFSPVGYPSPPSCYVTVMLGVVRCPTTKALPIFFLCPGLFYLPEVASPLSFCLPTPAREFEPPPPYSRLSSSFFPSPGGLCFGPPLFNSWLREDFSTNPFPREQNPSTPPRIPQRAPFRSPASLSVWFSCCALFFFFPPPLFSPGASFPPLPFLFFLCSPVVALSSFSEFLPLAPGTPFQVLRGHPPPLSAESMTPFLRLSFFDFLVSIPSPKWTSSTRVGHSQVSPPCMHRRSSPHRLRFFLPFPRPSSVMRIFYLSLWLGISSRHHETLFFPPTTR